MSHLWLQTRERRILIKELKKKEKKPEVQRSSVRQKNMPYLYMRQRTKLTIERALKYKRADGK